MVLFVTFIAHLSSTGHSSLYSFAAALVLYYTQAVEYGLSQIYVCLIYDPSPCPIFCVASHFLHHMDQTPGRRLFGVNFSSCTLCKAGLKYKEYVEIWRLKPLVIVYEELNI